MSHDYDSSKYHIRLIMAFGAMSYFERVPELKNQDMKFSRQLDMFWLC